MEALQNLSKSLGGLTVGWVDFLVIIVLLVGVLRGRKRGLSEELLDAVMWVGIVVACGLFYRKVADLMGMKPILSKLTYFMLGYVAIALVIKVVFMLIKAKFGQKMAESDMFGRLEFYGGMAAGAVRFGCIFLFAISLLHAPHYSPEFWAKRAKEVDYNFGSDFFPHPCKIQKAVFADSFTGKMADKHLAMLLIEQTDGNSKSVRDDNSIARRNERKIDAIMGSR